MLNRSPSIANPKHVTDARLSPAEAERDPVKTYRAENIGG
jgi:hypothetical protein